MIHKTVRRVALLFAVGGTGLALLAGCSSASSNEKKANGATTSATRAQGTPTKGTPTKGTPTKGTPTSSVPAKAPTSGGSSATQALGECSEASILAALPAKSTMVKFQCAVASPTMWATARVKPGPTVYFLQTKGGAWQVSKADQVCGTNRPGLPPEIRSFCP